MGLGVLLIIVAFVVVYVSYMIPAAALHAYAVILTSAAGSLVTIGLHIFVRGMGYGSKIEDKIIHPEL